MTNQIFKENIEIIKENVILSKNIVSNNRIFSIKQYGLNKTKKFVFSKMFHLKLYSMK